MKIGTYEIYVITKKAFEVGKVFSEFKGSLTGDTERFDEALDFAEEKYREYVRQVNALKVDQRLRHLLPILKQWLNEMIIYVEALRDRDFIKARQHSDRSIEIFQEFSIKFEKEV
ncbi:hypothetical protein [Priestia flexa]|uniref:hypothetical protein n=1 Tax=Priestia flexa TaxID=86664 RepID=UPI001C964ACA|nr:hypothetical protein [Priestia flexa]MBY6087014.1 hypothetical protein [Priestia flexa]